MLARDGIETSNEWIRTRTGIESRYFADEAEGETTSSLTLAAARCALEAAGVEASEIDLIIVATTTPDMVFPSVACRVQAALGAKGCAAFDVQAVCAGFIYALNAADAMLRAGPSRAAVVIGAEVMSRVLDMKDRSTCVLFGDGAGAVVLKASSDPGILAARMYADGNYGEKVLSLTASLNHGRIEGDPFIRMDGRQVFRLAVEGLVDSAREVAGLACVRTEDVALFVPHQANLYMVRQLSRALKWEDRLLTCGAAYANPGSCSVALALAAKGCSGRRVLIAGFGAGFSASAGVVRLSDDFKGFVDEGL